MKGSNDNENCTVLFINKKDNFNTSPYSQKLGGNESW